MSHRAPTPPTSLRFERRCRRATSSRGRSRAKRRSRSLPATSTSRGTRSWRRAARGTRSGACSGIDRAAGDRSGIRRWATRSTSPPGEATARRSQHPRTPRSRSGSPEPSPLPELISMTSSYEGASGANARYSWPSLPRCISVSQPAASAHSRTVSLMASRSRLYNAAHASAASSPDCPSAAHFAR